MQSCLDSDDKGFCMLFSNNLLKYVFLGAKRLWYIVRKNGLNSLKAIITSPPTSHLVKLSLPNICPVGQLINIYTVLLIMAFCQCLS